MNQLKIGITGGIGSGKSTVTNIVRSKGYQVLDADLISREIMEPGSPAMIRIREAFGDDVFLEDGNLNRSAMAEIVFHDDEARKKLDGITHVEICAIIMRRLAEAETDPVFLDAPLMFETDLDKDMDQTWLVTCRDEIRIKRVMARDNTSEEHVRARIAGQMPEAEKEKRADIIIDNSGTEEELRERVEELLKQYDTEGRE